MGRVTEISVSMGRTVNVGEYEFFNVKVDMTTTVDDDENSEEVYEELRANIYKKLQEQVVRILPD